MNNLLDVIVFQTTLSWMLLVATLVVIILTPRLFGINYINGLSYAQMTLFFNAVPIVAGIDSQELSIGRVIHFYVIEFSFLVLIFVVYRRLLRYRARILAESQVFFNGIGAYYLTVFMIVIAIFNYLMAPTDGSSRIEYMTAAWFSLIKPLIELALPLTYFGIFILLLNKNRRRLGYFLLVVVISSSIVTGSKASFVFGLLTAVFALRDLFGSYRLPIMRPDKWKLFTFVTIAIIFTLSRLNISIGDVVNRFLLFSDATILTYFSDNPTEACANVSTFASMHRGLARFLGDPSAMDINTLFGFALTIQELGVNTFTGPNARLSAYILCNFSNERVVFGIFVIVVYLCLLSFLFKRLLNRPIMLSFVYPFLVTSLGEASQDFNLIMQDITIFSLLFIVTLVYSKKVRFCFG